jgi:hypothetical protein
MIILSQCCHPAKPPFELLKKGFKLARCETDPIPGFPGGNPAPTSVSLRDRVAFFSDGGRLIGTKEAVLGSHKFKVAGIKLGGMDRGELSLDTVRMFYADAVAAGSQLLNERHPERENIGTISHYV